jgi:hypothetical protein
MLEAAVELVLVIHFLLAEVAEEEALTLTLELEEMLVI